MIVDLLTPASPNDEPRPTTNLTSVAQRLRYLNGRLVRVDTTPFGPHAGEAIEEMRHMSVSVSTALNAERALRIEESMTPSGSTRHSDDRIAKRVSELDMATRAVATMIDIHG